MWCPRRLLKHYHHTSPMERGVLFYGQRNSLACNKRMCVCVCMFLLSDAEEYCFREKDNSAARIFDITFLNREVKVEVELLK